eukprot:scaffold9465_cov113-Cylindrotheca_fusiformis.AAC.1
MLWNQKLGTLPSEIKQKFGILNQSSLQLGLDETFCATAIPRVTSLGNNLFNLTVPDHDVTNDRLVAHFPPQALYEYLGEQYDLEEINGGDDSEEDVDEEDNVEEDEEVTVSSSSNDSVETKAHLGYDPNVFSEDEYDATEEVEM